jgi:hypothetical protein
VRLRAPCRPTARTIHTVHTIHTIRTIRTIHHPLHPPSSISSRLKWARRPPVRAASPLDHWIPKRSRSSALATVLYPVCRPACPLFLALALCSCLFGFRGQVRERHAHIYTYVRMYIHTYIPTYIIRFVDTKESSSPTDLSSVRARANDQTLSPPSIVCLLSTRPLSNRERRAAILDDTLSAVRHTRYRRESLRQWSRMRWPVGKPHCQRNRANKA